MAVAVAWFALLLTAVLLLLMAVGLVLRRRRRQTAVWYFKMKWEPRDVWIGLYWTRPEEWYGGEPGIPPHYRSRKFYVCALPCLPLIIERREIL